MLYFCRVCSSTFRHRKHMEAHAKTHHEDATEEPVPNSRRSSRKIDETFDLCFPSYWQRLDVNQDLLSICKWLVAGRPRSDPIKCALCGDSVRYAFRTKDSCILVSRALIRHAASHLEKDRHPYKCRHCFWSSYNETFVKRHLKSVHELFHEPILEKDFDDITPELQKEIGDMLKTCFEEKKEAAGSDDASKGE